jgi:hypothetical protein
MNIIGIMPLYKSMDAPCVQALIAMISEIYMKGDGIKIVFTQGMNLCLARNQMLDYCADLKKKDVKYSYILALDHDHEYSAKALYTLIDKIEINNLPALSAAYYKRGNREFHMARDNKSITAATLGTGVQPCDLFGFGFNVFKPETIVKIFEYTKTPFQMDGDRYTSEDVSFCRVMKGLGLQPYYDADTIVGHYTSFFNK